MIAYLDSYGTMLLASAADDTSATTIISFVGDELLFDFQSAGQIIRFQKIIHSRKGSRNTDLHRTGEKALSAVNTRNKLVILVIVHIHTHSFHIIYYNTKKMLFQQKNDSPIPSAAQDCYSIILCKRKIDKINR